MSIQTPEKKSILYATQWQLIRRAFAKHKLAVASLYFLIVMYGVAIFAEFVAPYSQQWQELGHIYCPPQLPRFNFRDGLYVYAVKRNIDPVTFRKTYREDRQDIVPLGFFVKGEPYKLCGVIPWDRHFAGANTEKYFRNNPQSQSIPTFYLLGADMYGHDLYSRIIYGSRISLSVGIIGIVITFVLGLIVGGISGYVGGNLDNFIQRTIEIINAFPKLPLWLAFAAIMPPEWSPLAVYFGITVVLSLLGWTGLARVVRGKILALREEDYAVAARLLGAGHSRILFVHLLPGFTSHIIVTVTLSVPGMILGETSLSFLGLGLRAPIVSWGVLLKDCMNIEAVASYPWLLMPVVFIVVAVLCFNFLGDGLRDAADPYSSR
jgi:peptide/nickel transport system permease protein